MLDMASWRVHRPTFSGHVVYAHSTNKQAPFPKTRTE